MAEQPVQDGWGVDHSSTGFITDYEGTVLDSFFATDPKYNEGNSLQLCWTTSVDNLDEIAEERELDEDVVETMRENGITQKYSCGSKWVTEDGGATAEYPARAGKLFHASSQVGKIIDSAIGSLENYGEIARGADGQPVKVNLDGLLDVVKARGDARQADIWKGLRFRFQEVTFDFGTDKKGKEIKSSRPMPVEFLGVEGAVKEEPKKAAKGAKAAVAAPTAADKIAAAKAKAAKNKAGSGSDDLLTARLEAVGATAEQITGLRAALEQSDNLTAFTDLAVEIDGVAENDALCEAVVDEGASGLFALKG